MTVTAPGEYLLGMAVRGTSLPNQWVIRAIAGPVDPASSEVLPCGAEDADALIMGRAGQLACLSVSLRDAYSNPVTRRLDQILAGSLLDASGSVAAAATVDMTAMR